METEKMMMIPSLRESLVEILKSNQNAYFKQYLYGICAQEGVMFIEAVDQYKKMDHQQRLRQSLFIFESFISNANDYNGATSGEPHSPKEGKQEADEGSSIFDGGNSSEFLSQSFYQLHKLNTSKQEIDQIKEILSKTPGKLTIFDQIYEEQLDLLAQPHIIRGYKNHLRVIQESNAFSRIEKQIGKELPFLFPTEQTKKKKLTKAITYDQVVRRPDDETNKKKEALKKSVSHDSYNQHLSSSSHSPWKRLASLFSKKK